MKKLILSIILTGLTGLLCAQALQKGAFEIRTGVGFGVYTFKTNAFEDNTSAAVPGLINVGIAYQISDAFSVGLDYERNGFVTDADSNTKAVSQNIGLIASYNIVNTEKNILHAFLVLGTSNFRFDNFNDAEYVISRGSQVQLGMGWKHYFGETVGMFANFSIPYFSYNEFKDSKGNVYEDSRLATGPGGVAIIETRVLHGTMTGVNFRIGLALKFGGS